MGISRLKKSLELSVDYINRHIKPKFDMCVESISVIKKKDRVKWYVAHFNCEKSSGEFGFHIVNTFPPDTTPVNVIRYMRKEIPLLEGWGLTKEKYLIEYGRDLISIIDHKEVVRRAVEHGKPVPGKVVNDYPEFNKEDVCVKE